jgi:hypothetical protein
MTETEERTQCPFYARKYRCRYGAICQKTHDEEKDEYNDCWVAQYWLNAPAYMLARKPLVWKAKP